MSGRTAPWIAWMLAGLALAGCLSPSEPATQPEPTPSAASLSIALEVVSGLEIEARASLSDGASTGSIRWDWGDGTASGGNPARHAYRAEGTYTVVGRVEHATQGVLQASETITLGTTAPPTGNETEPPGQPPQEPEGNETDPRPFEPRPPRGNCGPNDSLTIVLPTATTPTGLAAGWSLLELDVVMLADPSFVAAHPDDWRELLADLVADANVHYEAQVGIRWNATVIDALPPGSLEAGSGDGKQRDVARGFMDARHPNIDWDIVAVILGSDYDGTTAGQVECVHGLAYKDYAYLWAEYDVDRTPNEGIAFFDDTPLKVFMHEAAHLLAAHHHYTNCGVPLIGYSTADALALCGVMINDIGLASFRFSETNKLVMRSFVEELGVGRPV